MRNAIFTASLSAAMFLFLLSCQKQDALISSDARGGSSQSLSKENTFYGPEKKLGDGKARSFITITHAGIPMEYGIIMTKNSMSGLPTDPNDHMAGTVYLPLHPKVKEVTPFSFIMLNWNPEGHEPPMVYGLPHFDFHFYFNTPQDAQMTFVPGADMEEAPPAGYLPADYISPAPGVPMMGKHWLDKFAPELPPTLATFDKTFIYGSYDGKVIFYEPMITRTLLMSGSSYEIPIKQPLYFSPTNTYYPNSYKIYTDEKNGDIIVSLSAFAWH